MLQNALEFAESAAQRVRTTIDLPPSASGVEIGEALGFMVDIDPGLRPYEGWFEGHCRRPEFARRMPFPTIWICPGTTDLETSQRAGHEIGHQSIEDQLPPSVIEAACQRFSAALTMEADTFRAALRRFGPNPVKLQSIFTHCSLDSIAIRIAELEPDIITTGWRWYGRRYICASEGLELTTDIFRATDRALSDLYGGRRNETSLSERGMKIRAIQTSRWNPHDAITICRVP